MKHFFKIVSVISDCMIINLWQIHSNCDNQPFGSLFILDSRHTFHSHFNCTNKAELEDKIWQLRFLMIWQNCNLASCSSLLHQQLQSLHHQSMAAKSHSMLCHLRFLLETLFFHLCCTNNFLINSRHYFSSSPASTFLYFLGLCQKLSWQHLQALCFQPRGEGEGGGDTKQLFCLFDQHATFTTLWDSPFAAL